MTARIAQWIPSFLKPRILDRYIFLEILAPFLVWLALLTTLFMSIVLKDIAGELFGKGISPFKISVYIFYLIAEKITQTIPVACLFSGILAAGRLSGDSEIVAMRSAGISFPRIYVIFIFFGFLATLLVAFMNLYYGPVSARAREDFENWIKSYHSLSLVKTGRFLGGAKMDGVSLKGQDIYAGRRDGEELKEVHIREWLNGLNELSSERIMIRNISIPIGDGFITQIVHAKSGQLVERVKIKSAESSQEPDVPLDLPPGVDPEQFKKAKKTPVPEEESKTEAVLRLKDGFVIEIAPDLSRVQTTDFTNGSMDYVIPPAPKPLGRLNVKPDNYTLWELYDFLDKLEAGGTEIDPMAILGADVAAAKIGEKAAGSNFTFKLPGLSAMKVMAVQNQMWIAMNAANRGKEGGPTEEQFQAMMTLTVQVEVFLKDAEKTSRKFQVEIQNRFAKSVACMLFFFISFPLGLVVKRSGRGMSFSLALVVFVAYFGLYLYGTGLGESGKAHPAIGAWLPDVVVAFIGVYVMASRTEGFKQRFRALVSNAKRKWNTIVWSRMSPVLMPVFTPAWRAIRWVGSLVARIFGPVVRPVVGVVRRTVNFLRSSIFAPLTKRLLAFRNRS